MFRRLTLRISFLYVVAVCYGAPNFSGTWSLDVSKSEFGSLPAPRSRTDRIDHREPDLKLSVTQSGPRRDSTYELNYRTDGSENTNTVRNNPMKSRLHWEGQQLVVETKGKVGGGDVSIVDRWTLAGDGRSFTVERRISSPLGETTQRYVFLKQ